MRTVPQLPPAGHGAPGAIVRITIFDMTFDVARDERGDVFVSVRRVCETLGLDSRSQLAKLAAKPWATEVLITSVDRRGRVRALAFLSLDALPMWLATIEASRVAPHVRPTLVLYQREAARVLREHFFGPRVPAALPLRAFPNLVAALDWARALPLVEEVERAAWRMALAGGIDLQRETWAVVLAELCRKMR